jgi:hypothetical protein
METSPTASPASGPSKLIRLLGMRSLGLPCSVADFRIPQWIHPCHGLIDTDAASPEEEPQTDGRCFWFLI